MIKLLLKEYDNYSGTIKFDGKNIKNFNEESFRNCILIVKQEPVLFNTSILENLRMVNENNNNISVGQKQRIAIARAILRNIPIILFDEATSALDNHSKNKIQETINELSKTKTIIMIAHSLEIVEDFDNIIMLDDGKIVKQGKHYELMNNHGKYYELANV